MNGVERVVRCVKNLTAEAIAVEALRCERLLDRVSFFEYRNWSGGRERKVSVGKSVK